MGFLKKTFRKIGKGLKKVAPAIGTAVGAYFGGPAGAQAGRALGKAVGGKDAKTLVGSSQVNQGDYDAVSGVSSNIGGYVGGLAGDAAKGLFGSGKFSNGVTSVVGGMVEGGLNNAFNSRVGVGQPEQMSTSLPPGYSDGVGFIQGMDSPIRSPAQQGSDTREYLANAYPELNPWERSGTGGTMFGGEMSSLTQNQEQANQQLAMQAHLADLNVKKDLALAKLSSDTQLAMNAGNNATSERVAGIASATSRLNTKDQVGIGQQQVDIANRRLSSELGKIAADTSLSIQAKEESIARTLKIEAERNNVQLSASQIKAITNQVLTNTESERLRQPGIIQENQNKRYGQGVLAPIFSFSNVLNDLGTQLADGVSGSMGPNWNR